MIPGDWVVFFGTNEWVICAATAKEAISKWKEIYKAQNFGSWPEEVFVVRYEDNRAYKSKVQKVRVREYSLR